MGKAEGRDNWTHSAMWTKPHLGQNFKHVDLCLPPPRWPSISSLWRHPPVGTQCSNAGCEVKENRRREEHGEWIHTRKDRNTVLALTANDRTAATEQIMRSDFKTSFCEENTSCEVCTSLFLSATLCHQVNQAAGHPAWMNHSPSCLGAIRKMKVKAGERECRLQGEPMSPTQREERFGARVCGLGSSTNRSGTRCPGLIKEDKVLITPTWPSRSLHFNTQAAWVWPTETSHPSTYCFGPEQVLPFTISDFKVHCKATVIRYWWY